MKPRSAGLIHKIISRIGLLLAVIVFNFFLFRVLPGDPIRAVVHSPRMTMEARERIRRDFGLDKPVWLDTASLQEGNVVGMFDSQFVAYIGNLLRGNLGVSFATRQPVNKLLAERLWRTALLLLSGEALAILLGVAVGSIAAWRRGSWADTTILLSAVFFWALPPFFLGIIALILAQGLLPIGGMVTPGLEFEQGFSYWIDVGKHSVMPITIVAAAEIGGYVLIMRSSMIDVLTQDYILTAKAKGLSSFQILHRHALKNAALPVVTAVAINLGYVVGGAIQVETVFSWPGIGRLMYESVMKQDYPVLQGAFLLLSASVIVANLLADLLYSLLDPRIALDKDDSRWTH